MKFWSRTKYNAVQSASNTALENKSQAESGLPIRTTTTQHRATSIQRAQDYKSTKLSQILSNISVCVINCYVFKYIRIHSVTCWHLALWLPAGLHFSGVKIKHLVSLLWHWQYWGHINLIYSIHPTVDKSKIYST